jgi:hypothetical protein
MIDLNYNRRFKEVTTISDTDYIYYDNGTQILQRILYSDFVDAINTSIGLPKYGSFYSTQIQTPTINTITAITYNNTDTSATSGISILDNSKIKVDTTGVYNIQFSVQLQRTAGGSEKQIIIWLRKNGVDVPSTSTHITMQSNDDYIVSSWNFYLQLNANEYAQLMMYQDDAIRLIYEVANTSVPYPIVPSVILTIQKIS